MSPRTNRKRESARTLSRLCSLPAYVSLSRTTTESSGWSRRVIRTNSLPMNPAPPVTSRRTSDVLDGPVESDTGIVPGDATFVWILDAVWLGHVVVENHVAHGQALVAVRDQRRYRHHLRRVLAEHQRLDASRGRGIVAKIDEHDARIALHNVPVIPLPLVPVERLD